MAKPSYLTHELKRIRQQPGELDDEPGGVGPVDNPMVVRERQRQHQSNFGRTACNHLLLTRARHSQNRHFRVVHDGSEIRSTDSSKVRDGKRAPLEIGWSELAVSRLLRNFG